MESQGSLPYVRSCRAPYSFSFDLVRRHWKAKINSSLHRVCAIARDLGASVLVAEDVSDRSDVKAELDMLRALTATPGIADATAFSFFRTGRNWRLALKRGEKPEAFVARAMAAARTTDATTEVGPFLGQVILVNYQPGDPDEDVVSYIYEAVMSPPRSMLVHDSYLLLQTFTSQVLNNPFQVNAAYYCQQNGKTNNCGHAAIRAIATRPGSIVSTNDINGAVPAHTSLPHDRFPQELLAEALRNLPPRQDRHPTLLGDRDTPRDELILNVAAVIESGRPALLTHGTALGGNDDDREDHIVAVVGYAIDRNLWHPQAIPAYNVPSGAAERPIQSAAWVRHVIVHDENFGPYRTLGIRSFPHAGYPPLPPTPPKLAPEEQIAILAHEARSVPAFIARLAQLIIARAQTIKRFPKAGARDWTQEFVNAPGDQVLRPLLIDKDRYLAHLAGIRGANRSAMKPSQIATLQGILPAPWFWMVELSHALLYTANDTKIGELLIGDFDPHRPAGSTDNSFWWMLRLPGHTMGVINNEFFHFPASVTSHAPMYHAPELTTFGTRPR